MNVSVYQKLVGLGLFCTILGGQVVVRASVSSPRPSIGRSQIAPSLDLPEETRLASKTRLCQAGLKEKAGTRKHTTKTAQTNTAKKPSSLTSRRVSSASSKSNIKRKRTSTAQSQAEIRAKALQRLKDYNYVKHNFGLGGSRYRANTW